MKAAVTRTLLALLLLPAFGLASSCSTEPALQSDNVVDEQAKVSPTTLEDVVVASEDEIPTWEDSTGKSKSSSDRKDGQQ